jgi:hypothetical protein
MVVHLGTARKRPPRKPLSVLSCSCFLCDIGSDTRINEHADGPSEPNDRGLPLLFFDDIDISDVAQGVQAFTSRREYPKGC